MKPKKSKKANLEKFRTIFFQVGMILTLSAILVAFEWTSNISFEELPDDKIAWVDIMDSPPIERFEIEKAIKPLLPIENIIVVDDDIEIEDLPNLVDEDEFENQPNWNFNLEDEPEEIDEPVIIAQFMPTFQGKDGNYFRNYVAKNVRFPERAREGLISGKVYISFVIDKDGSVTNVEILRGVHSDIDMAVLEVIKNSPRWEPGINNGKYVRVKYSIAIVFKLQ